MNFSGQCYAGDSLLSFLIRCSHFLARCLLLNACLRGWHCEHACFHANDEIKMKFNHTRLSLAVAASLLSSTAAIADDAIEVITVQGDFEAVNLQKSANSVSVLTDIEAQLRGAQNLEEIVAKIPNVNFSAGSQRARYYQIRGIGERSQFREPINPSVGVIIDDIDFTGIGGVASLFDVAQTEVFRGPQGTRFGANALAGLISIHTNEPTDEFEGAVKLTAGNFNSYGAGLVLSGPATDKVKFRIAAEQYNSDGFINNLHLNRDDTNDRDELSINAKLAIEASEHLTVDLTLVKFDFNNGYDAFSLDNNRNTYSDQPGFDDQDTTAFAAKFNYTGFDSVDVETIVSTADNEIGYGYDEDWAFVGFHPDGYSSTDHYFRDRDIDTAEVRIKSKTPTEIWGSPTDWIVGVYAKQDDETLLRQYTFLDSDFNSNFESDNIAAFFQIDSQLSEQLNLVIGARFEGRDADYINSDGFVDSNNEDMIGGKVVLSYALDADSLVYGSINRGYKAGGFNTEGSLTDDLREFDAEFLWNYELGYKANLLDGDAYLRSALFFMDRTDVQVRTSQTNVRPDGSSEFISFLGNAASGKNYGIELEAGWQLTASLELYTAMAWLETEFNNFINAAGDNLSGRDQAHAPNYQFSLGLNYQLNDHWLFNLSTEGRDSFLFSDSHNTQSDSVVLVNGSVSYQQDDWNVRLWVRNAFDRDYQTRGFFFGNDPRDGYTARSFNQLGEPAVFGVTVNYQF